MGIAESFRVLPVTASCLLALALSSASGAGIQSAAEFIASERDVLTAFKRGQHERLIQFFEHLPPGRNPSKELLHAALRSYLHLGRPESAFKVYSRLTPPGTPDDTRVLRKIALDYVSSRARDPEEYVRIEVYTSLAELASREVAALLEDGLLDSSVLVRAKAADGLGRAGLAASSPGLKRALYDPLPSVRIAALNALGKTKNSSILSLLTPIARSEEGPEYVFALEAMVKLGKPEALADIMNAATLPQADIRMAAIGVLGRLKRPASLSLLSQSVYDPDPAVRAFAAGALGEFGDPRGASFLTHALEDEDPRVRSVAAASLGRLGAAQARLLLRQTARDRVEFVRVGAVEGLLRLGDDRAILAAAVLAKHPDPSVRSATAQALGLAGNSKAIRILDPLLQDQQPQPRLMTARALGKIRTREVIQLLKKGLLDSDPAIRIAAAGSLLQVLTPSKAMVGTKKGA